jgi:hypothetical protein
METHYVRCFYLNLPVGGISVAAIFLFLNLPDNEQTKLPMREKLAQIDLPGSIFLLPGIACLLLALQWGGQTYSVRTAPRRLLGSTNSPSGATLAS